MSDACVVRVESDFGTAPQAEVQAPIPSTFRVTRRLYRSRFAIDVVIQKNLNGPIAGARLQERLRKIAPDRVLITGWATDVCVDATVRWAVSNHHNVVVVADGHALTTALIWTPPASFGIIIGCGVPDHPAVC